MVRAMAVVVVLVALLLALAAPAYCGAKAEDFTSLLSGKQIPLSMKLKDLSSTWRRFGGASPSPYGFQGPYYTKGHTVTVGGEVYLITYAAQIRRPDYYAMMGPRPSVKLEEVTPDTPLALSLLRLGALASLMDIRPFNLEAELADYKRANESILAAMAARRTELGEGEDNLKNLAVALNMYMIDYEAAPPMDTPEKFRTALAEYVESEDAFVDPDTGEAYAINRALSGKKVGDIEDPLKMVAIYQAEPGRDGKRGVAFVAGNVGRVSESEWQELKSESEIP